MAQRSGSGRGATAARTGPRNRTPNTPTIRESDIAQMRVEDIRGQLRQRGVAGISGKRKDELVKTLAQTLRVERRTPSAKRTGPPSKGAAAAKTGPAAKSTAAKKGTTAKKTAAKKTAAKKGTARTATAGRKSTSAAKRGGTATKASTTAATKGTATSGARQGGGSSRSLRYAQRISSPSDRPERPGRSLVTTDHEVIRRWARARNAKPATIEGSQYDGRPGVLRFNFPGFGESRRLREITWNEWFDTFDGRRLNFIYQEDRTNGQQSNFFRLESPEREDA